MQIAYLSLGVGSTCLDASRGPVLSGYDVVAYFTLAAGKERPSPKTGDFLFCSLASSERLFGMSALVSDPFSAAGANGTQGFERYNSTYGSGDDTYSFWFGTAENRDLFAASEPTRRLLCLRQTHRDDARKTRGGSTRAPLLSRLERGPAARSLVLVTSSLGSAYETRAPFASRVSPRADEDSSVSHPVKNAQAPKRICRSTAHFAAGASRKRVRRLRRECASAVVLVKYQWERGSRFCGKHHA